MHQTNPAAPAALTPSQVPLGPPGTSDVFRRLAERRIVVPNPQEVALYLLAHGDLAELLPPICAEIREALGNEVQLSLELYQDPEIDDRYLSLYARKEKYERDILDSLQAVSDRFNDRLADVSGYFLLTTDFSRPRGGHVI
jgi:hypothetical protein